MKKLILTLIMMFVFTATSFAATTSTTTVTTNWDSTASLKRVNEIGSKILKANGIPTQITFKVSNDESINAYANLNKEVYVFKKLRNVRI